MRKPRNPQPCCFSRPVASGPCVFFPSFKLVLTLLCMVSKVLSLEKGGPVENQKHQGYPGVSQRGDIMSSNQNFNLINTKGNLAKQNTIKLDSQQNNLIRTILPFSEHSHLSVFNECPFSCKYNLDPELKQQRRQQMTSGFLERELTPSEDIEPQHYQQ